MRQSKSFLGYGIGALILALSILPVRNPLWCHAEEAVPRGSIQAEFCADAEKIPLAGAEVRIYRVADVRAYTDELRYIYTEEFADCSVDFSRAGQAENASGIFQYIKEKGIKGVSAVTDRNGRVAFDALEEGLYLVAQIDTVDGFSQAEPFLVSIPYRENGALRYDVDATPKVALQYYIATDDPTPPPGSVVSGTGSTASGGSDSGSQGGHDQSADSPKQDPPVQKLPQTGQMWWPVPLLISMGFLFLTIGLWSRKEK